MFVAKALLLLSVVIAVSASGVPGGVSKLSGDDLKKAEDTLKTSLTKLAAGDGPNYQLGKVISATHQVVSGSLYKYEVELVDKDKATKKCNVEIWSQPWLKDGIQVTFDCPNEEKLVKKHSA